MSIAHSTTGLPEYVWRRSGWPGGQKDQASGAVTTDEVHDMFCRFEYKAICVKVINFFGAPGAGKSTAAAGLFYQLKRHWVRSELVTEFAKDLVWDGSRHLLSNQSFVFANQMHRLNRLAGQVDVAVSDSPLLISAYYAPKDYPVSFRQMVFDFFDMFDNLNIVVRRSHSYALEGRLQNEIESDRIADTLEAFLMDNGVAYYAITANDANPEYLLSWLVQQKIVSVPEQMLPLSAAHQPPDGWIDPRLYHKVDKHGRPVPRAGAVLQRHIDDDITTT